MLNSLFVTHYLFYFYFFDVCLSSARIQAGNNNNNNELLVHEYMLPYMRYALYFVLHQKYLFRTWNWFSSIHLHIALVTVHVCSGGFFSAFMHSIKFKLIANFAAHIDETLNEWKRQLSQTVNAIVHFILVHLVDSIKWSIPISFVWAHAYGKIQIIAITTTKRNRLLFGSSCKKFQTKKFIDVDVERL